MGDNSNPFAAPYAENLQPCRFCGGSQVYKKLVYYREPKTFWKVVCANCGASTAFLPSRELADQSWIESKKSIVSVARRADRRFIDARGFLQYAEIAAALRTAADDFEKAARPAFIEHTPELSSFADVAEIGIAVLSSLECE